MIRAVIYARVSSEKQVEGYSLQTQIQGCEQYADTNGFSIVERIEDPGFSGATLDRPGLTRVRSLAAAHKIDAVLIYARDRLARELIQDLAVCSELRAAGVAIHDVLRNKALTGDFSDHIDAIIAEEERRRIRERTVRGRHARVLAGKFPAHGKPPYGYRAEGSGKERTIVIDEEEGRIVKLIFTWYVFGDGGGVPLSTSQIAQKLSELQIPTRYDRIGRTKKRGYAQWDVETLLSILKQSAYRGIYYAYRLKVVNGRTVRTKQEDWHPVSVPAIIDTDLWEAAQQQIVTNRDESTRKTIHEYLVRGRVKCKCGYSASAKARKPRADCRDEQRYLAYMCNAQTNRRAKSCPFTGVSYGARKVDLKVWEWIVSTILDKKAVERGYNRLAQSRESEVARLQNERGLYVEQLTKCRGEIDALLVLYRTSKVKVEFLDAHIEPLQEAVERLEEEIVTLDRRISELDITEGDLAAVLQFSDQVRSKVAEFTFEQRRHLVELLDVRIELAVEDGAKVIYVTSRIDTARLALEVKGESDGGGSGSGSFDLFTTRS